MTLVVEDGTGLANSTGYMSVADFKAYHDCRGNEYFSSDDEIGAGIVRASDYIDKRFGVRFKGRKNGRTQALQWPRTGATDNDGYDVSGVPAEVKDACAEYALRALDTNPLAPDPNTNPTEAGASTVSGNVTRTTDRVGPIEETRQYESNTTSITNQILRGSRKVTSNVVSEASLPEYPAADLYLEPLLRVVDNRIGGTTFVSGGAFTGAVRDPRFTRGQFQNNRDA